MASISAGDFGYDALLTEGLQGRIEKTASFARAAKGQETYGFYKAALIVLQGFQANIMRHGAAAKVKYQQNHKENIRQIWESCEKIAYHPPDTFLEAVQLMWLAHKGIVDEADAASISFGRIDQYLYPYYERDLQTGKLTRETAQEILTALWKKIAEMEKSWQNVTIGGSDADGTDRCNELTLMCMQASLAVRGDQPQLSLRVGKHMPDIYWNQAFELIKTGMGFPSLFHDEMAAEAKRNAGVSFADAWDYSIVGCVELTAGGKEYSHTEGARFNWMKIMELMLNQGVCPMTGRTWPLQERTPLNQIDSFQQFYDWYKREFLFFTERLCEFIDVASDQYGGLWPTPFTSALTEGCMEKGKDVTFGGAVYNNLTLDCVGIASTADSLEAIERLVFEKKLVKLEELSVALNRDFEGWGWLREEMLACPKYGNDIDSVDGKMADLVKTFTDALQHMQMKYRQGHYQAGFYTSYFHATMGKLTGASPDGRKAGAALSPSLSPMAGMDGNGPTAVINSANKINMAYFGNGMALDLKFLPSFLESKGHLQALRALVEEYFQGGGLEVQFNVADREELIDAQENPWNHRNLIVRVSGFSAYFITLEKNLQDEIIRRIAHG